jgi:hypothetical protein
VWYPFGSPEEKLERYFQRILKNVAEQEMMPRHLLFEGSYFNLYAVRTLDSASVLVGDPR